MSRRKISMLSKPATMLLGLIHKKPLNAYEITKLLGYMNVKWWFNIPDSTVYTTIKNLEKRGLITGTIEKVGNMPDRTVYTLTEKGENEFRETLKKSILQFDYDTTIFSIAAFFIDIFNVDEKKTLLEKRLEILKQNLIGIEKQVNHTWESEVPVTHVANVKRMKDLVNAEISGTTRLLATCDEKEE